ncbi:MAG: hypothetical protein ACOZCO_15865 [Bacteroidota bacterium]
MKKILQLLVIASIFLFTACEKAERPEEKTEFGECGTMTHSTNVGMGLKSDAEIHQMVDERISYFVSQLGSEDAFEQFYGKTIHEIRQEFIQVFTDSLGRK